jgi:hypothetical protein
MLTLPASWACAVPTAIATILILMRDMLYEWVVRIIQRKHIGSIRKKKKNKKKRRKPPNHRLQ